LTALPLDTQVISAAFDSGTRSLVIATEGGTLRYERILALGMTLGARMPGPEFVADNLPGTMLTEHVTGLAKAEAPRGMGWAYGGEEDFVAAPVRDGIAFTGGRWFRLFVGAMARSVEANGD
jgi:hypothetical protein